MADATFRASKGAHWILCIIPAIAVVVAWQAFQAITPIYAGASGYDYDPAYVYLLNGLSLVKLAVPAHHDHPGTPLQVLCAVVIFVRWSSLRITRYIDDDVVTSVLGNPEDYIAAISATLLLLNAGALIYCGRRLFQATGSLGLGLLSQMTPFLFSLVPARMVYLAPEALLFFTSLCLLGILAPAVFEAAKGSRWESRKMPWIAGFIGGFGIAVKVTFLPMLGLFLLLRSRAGLCRAGIALVGALVIFLIPIMPRLPLFLNWLNKLLWHTGKYGSGAEGLVEIGAVWGRIHNLVASFPMLYLAVCGLLASITVILWQHRGESPKLRSALVVPVSFLLVTLAQTVFLAKTYAIHYMVPVLPLGTVALSWLVWKWSRDGRKTIAERLIPAGTLALCGLLGAMITVRALDMLRSSRRAIDVEQAALVEELAKRPDALVIGTYRCTLPRFALAFGLSYTGRVHDNEATLFFRNFLTYNVWNRKLRNPAGGWIERNRLSEVVASGGDILLVTTKDRVHGDFLTEPIRHFGKQSLYRVVAVSDAGTSP